MTNTQSEEEKSSKCNMWEHPAHNVKMHGSVVVGTKGQIVIPSGVRSDLNINPGDQMFTVTKHGKLVAFIKMDDMQEFLSYMQKEMDVLREMTKDSNLNQ